MLKTGEKIFNSLIFLYFIIHSRNNPRAKITDRQFLCIHKFYLKNESDLPRMEDNIELDIQFLEMNVDCLGDSS